MVQNKSTPLHVAASVGQAEVVQLLIQASANVNAETKVCALSNVTAVRLWCIDMSDSSVAEL